MSVSGQAYRESRRARGLSPYTEQELQTRRDTRKRRKIELASEVRRLKAETGCTDCGNHDPRVLDYDHLPGFVKVGNVSAMIKARASRKAVMDEIAKCEVVCANCHRIRTGDRLLALIDEG